VGVDGRLLASHNLDRERGSPSVTLNLGDPRVSGEVRIVIWVPGSPMDWAATIPPPRRPRSCVLVLPAPPRVQDPLELGLGQRPLSPSASGAIIPGLLRSSPPRIRFSMLAFILYLLLDLGLDMHPFTSTGEPKELLEGSVPSSKR